MKSNNQLIRKENLVSIVVTLLFVLGFFVLINNLSITSYTTLDNSTNNNFTFGIEASAAVVQNQVPANNTNTTSYQIEFIYNVSSDALVDNCSLYLDIDDAGFMDNVTLDQNYTKQINNLSDGFSTLAIGSDLSVCITTNGSDFWITDSGDDFVYHVNSTGDNQTDGFSTSAIGSTIPLGITTNGSDFWIAASGDDFVYHVNSTGDNQTDGFSTSAIGSDYAHGITTNGSDFWIIDYTDNFVYHVNSTGDNQTDGFSTLAIGSDTPFGITTNGSDFWIIDYGLDDFVYHVNSTGDNQTDGFSTLAIGSDKPYGITTSSFNMSLVNPGGIPKEFWILDGLDLNIYHIKISLEEIVNQTINISFDNDHIVDWKIGCYDNNTDQTNSSIRTLTIDTTPPTVNITFPKNNTNSSSAYVNFTYNTSDITSSIDSCILWLLKSGSSTWELNFTDTTITETINQSINITMDDMSTLWKVECNDTFNNRGNSSIFNITIDTIPPFVQIWAPVNTTNSTNKYVNFTYNVTDSLSNIDSCILWLYQNGAWGLNDTDTSITETINQTFNKSFTRSNQDNLKWKVECNDTFNNRGNSSVFKLIINKDQLITLIEPTNNTRTTETSLTFTYNVTDPDNDIDNCTLFHSLNNTAYTNVSIDNTTINETITNSFTATIDNEITYQLYWKVGCYTNDTYHLNSTENLLITTLSSSEVLESGGGGGVKYKNITQYENLTQPVYIFLPAPTADENARYVIQKIDMAKMNMDPNFQKLLGSAVLQIDLEDIPMEKVVGTIGETMFITIGKEAKIDIDTSEERTRIAIRDILKEGLQKPEIPSLLWKDIKTLLLLMFLIASIFFSASKIYPNLPQIKDFVKNRLFKLIITGALFKFSRLSKKIPKQSGPVVVKFEQKPPKQKSSIIFKESENITIETLKQDTVKTSKITNNKIKAFNKVHDLIIQDINKNQLDLASKRYEELLKIYNYLILRLNKQEQILIYQDFKEIYNELNNAIEIHFLKKKLK